MRKCDRRYENPIDNVIIDSCDYVCPLLYALHFTPNIITTIGTIVYFLALVNLCRGNMWWFVALYVAGYWLDCLDGHYARKYHMETEFGDYFDHVRDLLLMIAISIIIFMRYNNKVPRYVMMLVSAVLGIMLVLMIMYIGCLDCIEHSETSRPHSATLSFTRSLCVTPYPEHFVSFFRYFGHATNVLVLLVMILGLEYYVRHCPCNGERCVR